MRRTVREARLRAVAALVVAMLTLAGCGGSKSHTSSSASPARSTAQAGQGAGNGGSGTSTTTPSDQLGGGTAPARAPAMLTGSGGRITPASVQVPPYIAVELSLDSADGGTYRVAVAGKSLAVSGSHRSASLTLPGLRPGARYTATPAGGGAAISITPSAEPGP